MVEPLGDFVERPDEFERLIAHLLDENRETPTALTAALRGAGGYGKTVLARALCHDERVRRAFPDGILWVTLGQTPDVLRGLLKLYAALTGQRPAFVDVEDAANGLAAQLAGRDCLLVVDDVWRSAHLRPFLRGGERCARLITTRDGATLPTDARTTDVDAMQQGEAVALLGAGLPPADKDALRDLAARLGEWPLLLKLVNGQLRRRVRDYGQPLPAALADVYAALDRRGLTAFDARDSIERDQAVAKTVELSLEMLDPEERDRYGKLAIFPEDADVPLPVLEKLWGLDGFEVKELCARFWQLALLLRFDLAEGAIRLHDVMRAYLAREHTAQLPTYHARLLAAYAEDVDDWAALPPDEHYLWRHLAYHLHGAERGEELDALLLDFDWLLTKLVATDVNAILADFEFQSGGEGLSLVQSAIRLSAHVLARDHAQLPGQLLGRLLSFSQSQIRTLLDAAAQYRGSLWLRPLTPTLTPPGGPLLRTLTGHTDQVIAVAVTPDGRRAVSASADHTLKVWDLESGEELRTLTGHTFRVWAVAVTPDGRRAVSASYGKILKVWDLESGAELCTLTGHTSNVRAVAVTPDGRRAVSASDDNTLKVWDLESGEELCTLTGHTNRIWAVAVTPDGRRVVSAAYDRTLKVWDLESGAELCTLTGHTSGVRAVAVTPDGQQAISASRDKTLKVWDLEDGKELRTLTGHTSSVNAVAVTSDGRRAISASSDKTLKVWNLESEEDISTAAGTLTGHTDSIRAVAVTPDGRQAVSASYDKTLKVWDLDSGVVINAATGTLTGHTSRVRAVAVTSNGQWVVSASDDRTLKVWDLENDISTAAGTLTGHRGNVNAAAVTPDGRWAVSASDDQTLKVWDLENEAELCTLAGHTSSIRAVAVTPDGRRAVSASNDRTLKVWDLESEAELCTLTGHTSGVNAVAVTSDGRRTISASWDKTLKVWDLESGEELRTLTGHTSGVSAVAVTPDGRWAVSASVDQTLKVWNLESGEELATLTGHTSRVRAVTVTPDGQQVVSASSDKTLKVWNLESRELVATFSGEGVIFACAVAPDGTIVAGGASGRVHFLRLVGA
ncbi:MAG: hypothetical protein GY842_14115 [bacterium]|nr:hypothetical protein [bacterium]